MVYASVTYTRRHDFTLAISGLIERQLFDGTKNSFGPGVSNAAGVKRCFIAQSRRKLNLGLKLKTQLNTTG